MCLILLVSSTRERMVYWQSVMWIRNRLKIEIEIDYHEKLLNAEVAWDTNWLSQTDRVSGVPRLIDKDKSQSQSIRGKLERLQDHQVECQK